MKFLLFIAFSSFSFSQFVPSPTTTGAGGGGGAVTPSTTKVLVGTGAVNGVRAGVPGPGNDYQSGVMFSAADYNTANNGIAGALSQCPAANSGVLCFIVIPPNYTGSDQISAINSIVLSDQNTYPANVSFYDYRTNATYSSQNCLYSQSNNCSNLVRISVYGNQQSFGYQNVLTDVNKLTVTGGGYFQPGAVSNYIQTYKVMYGRDHGQYIASGTGSYGFGPSDVLVRSDYAGCPGGVGYSGFSEGCEYIDAIVSQVGDSNNGAAEPVFTTSTAGTGLNSITISAPSQGVGQLGTGRYVVPVSGGVANTVTAWGGCTDSGSQPCTATMGTAVTASTVYGTINSAITSPGSQPVTIGTFILGSAANLAVGQLMCVADYADEPECVKITQVSGATVTANFHYQHSYYVYVGIGGLAGQVMSINADNVTSSTYPEINLSGQNVVGTLHLSAWPIIACTTTTSCIVAVNAKGGWRQIAGDDKWTASNNGVTIYPAAKLLGVNAAVGGADSSVLGGPVTLADNNETFTNGETLTEFYAPSQELGFGNVSMINFKGNHIGAASGFGLNYYGVWANNDCLMCLNNHTQTSLYGMNGGPYGAPLGVALYGQFQYALSSQYGGQYADLGFGCQSSGCNDYNQVIAKGNSAGTDLLAMMGGSGHNYWYLTSNNQTGNTFRFRSTGLETNCLTTNTQPSAGAGDYIFWVNCNTWTPYANDSSGVSHALSSGSVSSSLGNGQGTIVKTTSGISQINIAGTVRNVTTGTTDTILASDAGGLVTYNNGAYSVGLPQANAGGNFTAGQPVTITNYGTGVITITATTSLIGPTVSSQQISAATGSGATIVTHSITLWSDGTNWQIASKN